MSEWQPIDSAPKDGSVVMLFVPKGVEREGYIDPPEEIKNLTFGWFGYTADRGKKDVWICDQVVADTFHGSEWTGSWTEYEWLEVTPTHWMPVPHTPA